MLEKINSILKFKYSFIAFLSFTSAIVLNLLSNLNYFTISLLIIICSLLMVFFALKWQKIKISLVCGVFFVAGLVTSAIYNDNFRVYELNDIINNERAWVSGQISQIDIKNKYAKLELSNPTVYSDTFDALDYKYVPNLLVSTHSSRLTEAKIGDQFVAQVLLKKPSGKLFADDFDYASYLLGNRINLTAQVRGDIYITKPAASYTLLQQLKNYRFNVANKINNYYEDKGVSGLSIALITGFRGYLDNNIKDDFKYSGLAHLMAISGMHMAFLAGIVFLLVRFMICLVPVIALNYDSKKIAGFITIFFALFYLILAGSSLPTIRAFCMVLMFVITLLFNRSKLALHTLCIIAILILTFDPMAIFSASFQLSFSAVFAMLLYNQLKPFELHVDFSTSAKIFRNFINTLNISIIAFTATMFFVASHFSYISIYSISANVIASILMAFIVMPVLFVFFIGYVVFDIQIFANLNQYSLNLLIELANYFANFDNASVYISENYSYVLLAASLLILGLIIFDFNRKYLLSGAILLVVLLIPVKFNLKPEILELSNSSVALRLEDKYVLLGDLSKRELKKVSTYYHIDKIGNNLAKNCDSSGCIYDFANQKILQMNEGFNESIEDVYLTDYIVKDLTE